MNVTTFWAIFVYMRLVVQTRNTVVQTRNMPINEIFLTEITLNWTWITIDSKI